MITAALAYQHLAKGFLAGMCFNSAPVIRLADARPMQQGHSQIAIESLPGFLLPRKFRYGLHDYGKILCPDLKAQQDIYETKGIDRNHDCMVIVQPDQYIAHILPLDARGRLAEFFDGCRPARDRSLPS